MNGKHLKLFRIFDIDIQLHSSWWFLAILLSWSLASAYFPFQIPGYTTVNYWLMGITATVLLFASVILHELSHSLVAKAKKINVKSITLFFFGGVAAIDKEDMKPSAEFFMAIAGPVLSIFLAGIFFSITKLPLHEVAITIFRYLAQLNLILALFNLVPGYPLDGGRAFRAILYAYYKDLKKATRIASNGGKLVGGILVVLGIFGIFSGLVVNGIFFIFLGGFLYMLAGASYEQVIVKETFSKVPITQIMQKKFISLNPSSKFSEFIKQFKNSKETTFLLQGKGYLGILDLRRLNKLPQKLQEITKLKQVAIPLNEVKLISEKDSAYEAFKKFSEQNIDLLPVMKGKSIVGVVYRDALLNRLMIDLKFKDGHHRLAKRIRR